MAKRGQATIPTREDIAEVIAECERWPHSVRNKAIVMMFLALGLRPKELTALVMDDMYDFERDRIHRVLYLKPEYTKRNKPREVPAANQTMRECLRAYINQRKAKNLKFRPDEPLFLSQRGGRFSANSIGNLMNELLEKRCGIRRASAYSGRRYFITTMHRNGVGLKTIQELVGHESIATTQIYIGVTDEDKIDAVKGVI